MDEILQAQLVALAHEVEAASIPDGCKHTTAWCVGQLPGLYARFRATSESRYGEEITRLIQGLVEELTTGKKACPEGQKLASSITEQLRLLHEQFGLPGLTLKSVAATPSRSRKAG